MRIKEPQEFREYAEANLHRLRRTAYLICGDWHHAEDIAQTTLTKLYCSWPRRRDVRNLDAYTHKILARACIDHSRRRSRREEPSVTLPDPPADGPDVAGNLTVRQALDALAPGQRAVLVLRYWADLDIAATAKAMGCTTGTVKSQTARALKRLRELLGDTTTLPSATTIDPEEVTIRCATKR